MEKFDEKEQYAQTRKSLIERLADWEDQRTWEEFYQTYWRLIYSVSIKAGLGRDEAFDVVQETVLTVAKQWKKGQVYDPTKGSFKTWLMNITRWRIADQFRGKLKNPAAMNQAGGTPGGDGDLRRTGTIERIEGENGADLLEQVWENEWRTNLTEVALDRVKKLVSPKQFQIFHANVIKEWDTEKVKKELGVSQSQVYLAKHRVGNLVKKEIENLKREFS
ncbi:MAG: sigma-70 family RNA polymerase sigma factor [Verrucomicrobiales bacterium]|nr:sigma-70 family RNA polymerase sigma factor [Verrucomicrobiales bacterium]MBP9224967.1 sigma-70 family RNA polymerase sigma factor [Verrucomicrobiales bacterium]